MPDLRTYFSSDLIPVLETQQSNFASLDGTSSVNWIAPLLLIVGLVVILFAALMIALNLRGPVSRGLAIASASVVLVVGVGVVALVLVLSLIPRVSNGQELLDALRPANVAARVQGDRDGITMVSAIVDTEDPIMTAEGGAAAEVPKLIAFVSQQTGLSQAEVVAALQENFPHTTALLLAIPLSSVTEELPGLFAFLEKTLGVTEAELLEALGANFPGARPVDHQPAGGHQRVEQRPGHRRGYALRRHARQDRARRPYVLQLGRDPCARDPARELRKPRIDLEHRLHRASGADRRHHRDHLRAAHAAPGMASGARREPGHQTLTETSDVAAVVDAER